MKIYSLQSAFVAVCLVLLLVGCNIYRSLSSKSTPEDYIEEAQKCLHQGNFDCAIENYSALPEGDLKKQKLCTVYLAKGGLTLNVLINVVTKNTGTMLGDLANALIPYTATKSDDLELAKTKCADYASSATSGNLGVLLRVLSLMTHCGIRLAKTDVLTANAGGANCEVTNTLSSDRVVRQNDIADDAAGNITTQGMCDGDVDMCAVDFQAIDSNALESAGLSKIKAAIDALPPDVKAGASTIATRGGLRNSIAN